MTCERFDELIDLYAAGEAGAPLAADLEQHAASCAECRRRLEGARRRLALLDATLARFRAADDFVARAMNRIRAEAERPAEPAPERLSSRLFRYGALAAAACFFLMAGYNLLWPEPAALLVSGRVSRIGANAATLVSGPGLRKPGLRKDDVLATAAGARDYAEVALARRRLRAVVMPNTILRIADPRAGAVAHLDRGGLVCTAARLDRGGLVGRVRGERECPAVATPLGRVAAVTGRVRIHVAPRPAGEGAEREFHGLVIVAAHGGLARVELAGHRGRALTLRPGQVLVLRSDPRQRLAAGEPLPVDALRRKLLSQLGQVEGSIANLTRHWEQVSEMVRQADTQDHPRLFVVGVQLQARIRQAATARDELRRRLDLLERCQQEYEAAAAHLGAGR